MNSDEDKIYMKIVTFDKIYNFVIQNFFIWSLKKLIYYPDLDTVNWDLDSISIFWIQRWLQMKKVWTTKL
jgi:hypothetical protein